LRELAEMRMRTPIDRDALLVAALRRRDPRAPEDFVATYGDRACRLATRITYSVQDAEEAVQDAFLLAIQKIDSFRGESAFGSWFYRIVANAAYQRCRRRRGRGPALSARDDRAAGRSATPPWRPRGSASTVSPGRA